MGDDNIYIKFGTDADQDKWTEADWIQFGTTYDVENTDNIQWDSSPPGNPVARGGFYKGLLKNTTTGSWDMVFRLLNNTGNDDVANPIMWIKLNDGNYYIVGMQTQGVQHSNAGYDRSTSRPTASYDNLTLHGAYNIINTWIVWVGLRFNSDGSVDLITGRGDGTRDPPSMTVRVSNIYTEVSVAKILEIGFQGVLVQSFGNDLYRLFVDADEPTPEGGDAVFKSIQSINALSAIGGGGAATIMESYDPFDNSALDHVRANSRKSVLVYRPDGVVGFKGEIDRITIGYDTITYQAEEGLRKLNDSFCGINPIVYRNDILTVRDVIIRDEYAAWEVGIFDRKLLITKDSDIYSKTDHSHLSATYAVNVHLTTYVETWVLIVPDNGAGDYQLLYFDNPDITNVMGSHLDYSEGGDREASVGHRYTFRSYEKQGTEWDSIKLNTIIRFTSLKGSQVNGTSDEWYPKIWIYNYTTTDWDLIFNWTRDTHSDSDVEDSEVWNTASIESADDSAGKSPVFTDEFNLLELLGVSNTTFRSNYMEEQDEGAVNSSGFKEYQLKIRVRSPTVTDLFNDPKMEVHYIDLTYNDDLTKDDPQGQQLSVGIISNNDAKNIIMSGITGWELATFPQGDGVTVGDEYFITDAIQDVLDEIFDADPIFSVDYTIAISDIGETEDLTYTPKYDLIQKYADMLNLVFWYVATETTDIVKIVDVLSSSGINLTVADIVGWRDGSWRLTLDSSNLRERIVFIGDEGLIKVAIDGVDYNVAYTDTLGNEDVIYRDDELYTQRNVDQAATSKQNLHSEVRETIPLPIDLTNRVQSYTALTVGSTVAFTGTILGDYSGDDELMVESISMDLNYEESDKMTVIFNLQKRVI